MNTLKLLISKIGESIYYSAVAELEKIRDETNDIDLNIQIPDVEDAMAGLDFSEADEWEVWNELIVQLPCYKIWMNVYLHYTHKLNNSERLAFLGKMAYLLDNATDAVSAALQHALLVDFFEGDDVFEGIPGPALAWKQIEEGVRTRKGKDRLLNASAPIPFDLKAALFSELINDKTTHMAILKALHQSLANPWCKAEKSTVSKFLNQLEVDASDPLYRAVVSAI